jgi:hypothetical protein
MVDSFDEVHGRKVGVFFFVKGQLRHVRRAALLYTKKTPRSRDVSFFLEGFLV